MLAYSPPPCGEGSGVGASSPRRVSNLVSHTFEVLQHIVVPEPQHAKSLTAQIRIPPPVRLQPARIIMLTPINLDNQSSGETGEIDNVLIDWNLPTKMKAAGLKKTQLRPKLPFCESLVIT